MDTTNIDNRFQDEQDESVLAEQKRNDEEDRDLNKKTIKETPWVENNMPISGSYLSNKTVDFDKDEQQHEDAREAFSDLKERLSFEEGDR